MLIEKLNLLDGYTFFWIGDHAAGQRVRALFFTNHFINLCDKIPLSQLGTFLKMCDLLVSIDSGPIHVAAAHQIKTVVLFSGTNDVYEWGPIHENATILSYPVPCAPCHKVVCPKPKHECMLGITPQMVYQEILQMEVLR